MGEGDKADQEIAMEAYSTVRGSLAADAPLPHWSELPETMQMALQFAVAHATLHERAECAKIAEVTHTENALPRFTHQGNEAIAKAIRDRV